MQFALKDAFDILERTPDVLESLLSDQSESWLNCRIEPGSFSPVDILGHLIYGELTDWIPRARIILQYQESRPFDPFDRFGFAPLIQGKSVDRLLDQFASLREKNLETLDEFDLGERELDLRGMHPELGPVTMRNLLATWVAHDLGHIAQIMRVMANEYKEAVGPWRPYVSIVG